jgi:hypothetical protein
MAIRATDLACEQGMRMRETEFAPFVEMALKAGFGGFSWINNRVPLAAAFDVETAGAVA